MASRHYLETGGRSVALCHLWITQGQHGCVLCINRVASNIARYPTDSTPAELISLHADPVIRAHLRPAASLLPIEIRGCHQVTDYGASPALSSPTATRQGLNAFRVHE